MEFADRATRDLFNGMDSKLARNVVPAALRQRTLDKLTLLEAAVSLEQLKIPPGNRLEILRGDRLGQHSTRVNDQFRICFHWTDAGPIDVEIVDYHN
jgi:proteic killer suppression protein